MGLDEALFGRMHRWVARRLRRDAPQIVARRVSAVGLERRLGVLASVLAGRNVEVRPTGDHGGIRRDCLFVPVAIDWAPTASENLDAYLLRIALGVAALDESASQVASPHVADADARAIATLIHARRVRERAARAWPGLDQLFGRLAAVRDQISLAAGSPARQAMRALERVRLGTAVDVATRGLEAPARDFVVSAADSGLDRLAPCVAAWRSLRSARREPGFDLTFWGDLLIDRDTSTPIVSTPAPTPESRDALPSGTERDAPRRRHVEQIELSEDEDHSPLVHVFEKVKTAEEHQGGHRELDGSDELGEHLDALEELDLTRVSRSRKATASIYRADLLLDGASVELQGVDPGAAAIRYDEWDETAGSYRDDWCSVFVGEPEPADGARTAAAIRAVRGRHARGIRMLRGEFERIERARALRHRQAIGTDIDLDAVVDRHAALRAARQHGGRVGDERLYVARRPGHHDLATLVLLDASLSTDSWVQDRRVLDVARESVIVLGEVLRDVRLRVGVAAFFSNARQDCRFLVAKHFDEDWSLGYRRLFGIRPTGYTRIGPALRHATTLLRESGCRRKLLILISDGKPTDYDRYEGRYGIADVRQALRESRRDGVRTVALTIDARAKEYLPRMFGEHGFRVLRHPGELPDALARLHERVMR